MRPDPDRLVAGLRCREVLADLSDYFDGELPPERTARIDAHLAGCDWCERFGGRYAAVVGKFRAGLREADPLDADTAERLRRRLRMELQAGG